MLNANHNVQCFFNTYHFHYFHIDHNAPCLPPEFCITVVSKFSWVLQSSQEKSKTMVMQSFEGGGGGGGGDKGHYGLYESGELSVLNPNHCS